MLRNIILIYGMKAVLVVFRRVWRDSKAVPSFLTPSSWNEIWDHVTTALEAAGKIEKDSTRHCGFKPLVPDINTHEMFGMDEHFSAAKSILSHMFYEKRSPEQKVFKNDQVITYYEDTAPAEFIQERIAHYVECIKNDIALRDRHNNTANLTNEPEIEFSVVFGWCANRERK